MLPGPEGKASDPTMEALGLENVGCLSCGATERVPWGTEAGFNADRCVACGLVYVTPRPAAEAQSEAARLGSHRRVDGTLNVTGSYSRPRELSMRYRMARLYGYRNLRGVRRRWLDLGCGHGELMNAVRSILPDGCEVIGVEPNEKKRRGALSRGLLVHASLDEVHGAFDVVSLMNVYSHLPDPVATFSALAERLCSNGELLVETGNGAELSDGAMYPGPLDLPDHLSFAGERQLRSMLCSAGLEMKSVQSVRLDSLGGTAWELLKGHGRNSRWRRPFQSEFRDLYIRAQLSSGPDESDNAASDD